MKMEEGFLEYLITLNSEGFTEEIKSIIELENYDKIIEIIIKKLETDYKEYEKLLEDEIDLEDLKNVKREIQNIEEKKQIINSINETLIQKQKQEQLIEQKGNAKVLFATNKYGNVKVYNDLKKLKRKCDKEVFEEFIELIEALGDDYKVFIDTKQGSFKNNRELKGLYKLKNFQARLIYRYVGDYIVIIGAYLKKSDNDTKYREFCINAKKSSNHYIEKIAKYTPEELSEEEQTSKITYEKIKEDFVNKGRGKHDR